MPLPESVASPLVRRLRNALVSARTAGELVRSPAADERWSDLYGRLAEDDPPGSIGALTSRAEAQLLRLSLVYALLDGSARIEESHLESAWEFWRYCRWSAQHTFVGHGSGDADIDRIAMVLESGEINGRDLAKMFPHQDANELRERAVQLGIAELEKRASGGRPSVLLVGKADKGDKPLGQWWRRPTFVRKSALPTAAASEESGGMRRDKFGEHSATAEVAMTKLANIIAEARGNGHSDERIAAAMKIGQIRPPSGEQWSAYAVAQLVPRGDLL